MTDPRLWLLDAAFEAFVPLHWLAAANLEEILNRPGHGLSAADIATELANGLEAGELRIRADPQLQLDVRALSRQDLFRLIAQPINDYQPCWFGLTGSGGAIWEHHVRPDWRRYGTHALGVSSGRIEAACDHLAEEILELAGHIIGREPRPASIRRSKLRPWTATYWKTLPEGFRITFNLGRQRGGAPGTRAPAILSRWAELMDFHWRGIPQGN